MNDRKMINIQLLFILLLIILQIKQVQLQKIDVSDNYLEYYNCQVYLRQYINGNGAFCLKYIKDGTIHIFNNFSGSSTNTKQQIYPLFWNNYGIQGWNSVCLYHIISTTTSSLIIRCFNYDQSVINNEYLFQANEVKSVSVNMDKYYFYIMNERQQFVYINLDFKKESKIISSILPEIPNIALLDIYTNNKDNCIYKNIQNNDIIIQQIIICLEDNENIIDIQYYGDINIIIEGEINTYILQDNIVKFKQPKSNVYLIYNNNEQIATSYISDVSEIFELNQMNIHRFNNNYGLGNNNLLLSQTDNLSQNKQKVNYTYVVSSKYNLINEQFDSSIVQQQVFINSRIYSVYMIQINDNELDDDQTFQYGYYDTQSNRRDDLIRQTQYVDIIIIITALFLFFSIVFGLLIYRRVKKMKNVKAQIECYLFNQKYQITRTEFDSKYDIDFKDSLGAGTFGEVYKVKNKHKHIIKNDEILKKMPDYYACKQIVFESRKSDSIMNEIEVLEKLKKYDNIIQMSNYVIQESNCFIVFDLADKTLQNFINQKQINDEKFSQQEIIDFIVQIGKTIAIIYIEEKIVHRDIKPQNILLKDGIYYLSDFGCAQELIDSTEKRENMVLGTIKWMSPEVQKGDSSQEIDYFKSDIFSFGMILLYMLSLQDISQVNSDEQIKRQKLRVMKYQRKDDIDENVILLVHKMLETDPDKRPDASLLFSTILKLTQQPDSFQETPS